MKIKVQPAGICLGLLDVYFYDERDGRYFVAEPVNLNLKEVSELEEPVPTFRMNRLHTQEFLQSMAEELERRGIKTKTQQEEEARNKGVLESTRYHLEDMRKLVFEGKENAK